MKKTIKICVLLLFLLISNQLFSQIEFDEHPGVYVTVQAEFVFHHKSVFNYNTGNNQFIINDRNVETQELNYIISAGWYDIERKYAIGLGFGVSNNNSYSASALPLFLEGRYFLFPQENSPFAILKVGRVRPLFQNSSIFIIDPSTGVGFGINGMRKGYMASLGIGHKLKFFKRLSATVSVSYDIKRYSYSDERYSKSENYLNLDGLSVSIALFIK